MKQYRKQIMIGIFCAVFLTACTVSIRTDASNSKTDSPFGSVEGSNTNGRSNIDSTISSSASQKDLINDAVGYPANPSAAVPSQPESQLSISASSSEAIEPTGVENSDLLPCAVTLTQHLVDYSFPYHADKGFSTPENLTTAEDGFVIYRFMYAQHKYFDEPTDPYYGFFDSEKLKTDITAIVPLKDAKQIALEVFGADNWPEKKDLDGFDPQEQCFKFPLEICEYSIYTAQNISAEQIDSQTIAATFDLVSSDSAAKNYGKYKITYQILKDSGREFLRFQSCLPC